METADLEGKSFFSRVAAVKLEKAIGGKDAHSPPSPSIANTRAEVASETHTGWVPSFRAALVSSGCGIRCQLLVLGVRRGAQGQAVNHPSLGGNELILPDTWCVN